MVDVVDKNPNSQDRKNSDFLRKRSLPENSQIKLTGDEVKVDYEQ